MPPLGPEALVLVALVSFGASLLGGVAGYGTGLILPPILVPLIGAEAVVPVIGLSALLTNAGRVLAYRAWLDGPTAMRIAVAALPGTALGAWGFSALGGSGAALVIGATLVALVPLRRWARRAAWRLGPRGATAAGAAISIALGTVKTLTFASAGALDSGLVVLALVIGGAGFPGGFLARRFALRMGNGVQTAILDSAVTLGGLLLIWEALR